MLASGDPPALRLLLHFNPVSSVLLGAIQGDVGILYPFVEWIGCAVATEIANFNQAKAGAKRNQLAVVAYHDGLGKLVAQAFDQDQCPVGRRVGQDQEEFLATPSAKDILFAYAVPGGCGNAA